MTNIEEEFFKTFGIEPFTCCDEGCKTIGLAKNCEVCPYNKRQFPRINSYMLLELICLHSTWSAPRLCATNIKALKRQVLRDLICEDCDKLREQVQALFKGEWEE